VVFHGTSAVCPQPLHRTCGSASVVRQVSANTFKVTKPDGTTFTVAGARPVSVPGPWVITKIA
jgi:hypothetical protein